MNFKKFAKGIELSLVKHSPEILTGIGIGGMFTAIFMAAYVTPKALDRLAEVKEKHENDSDKKELAKDITIKVIPLYIPTVLTAGISTACLIGACSVNNRRTAALATAYTLSEGTLKEYQSKVIEKIGEKKEQDIRDAVAADKIAQDPVTNKEVFITGGGKTLCYDSVSGRYFESDIDTIRKVENMMDKRLRNEMFISLNEVYYELGLKPTEFGNEMGFNIDDGDFSFDYSAQLADDGRPCLVLSYIWGPRYKYGDL